MIAPLAVGIVFSSYVLLYNASKCIPRQEASVQVGLPKSGQAYRIAQGSGGECHPPKGNTAPLRNTPPQLSEDLTLQALRVYILRYNGQGHIGTPNVSLCNRICGLLSGQRSGQLRFDEKASNLGIPSSQAAFGLAHSSGSSPRFPALAAA